MLKRLVASADKAEVRVLFQNGKTVFHIRITLNELGFPQPPTPIKRYKSDAEDIVTAMVRQKYPRQCICCFIG